MTEEEKKTFELLGRLAELDDRMEETLERFASSESGSQYRKEVGILLSKAFENLKNTELERRRKQTSESIRENEEDDGSEEDDPESSLSGL